MRRTFRRHIRKTLAENVPPILQEANFVFDKGEYGRAAELFENIAQAADGRGGPRAPIYYLQAGRARVLAGQAQLGIPSLKRGLELLAQRGKLQRFHQAGDRVLTEINSHGLKSEAAEMESWIRKLAPPLPSFEVPKPDRPALPTHCPSCGAALKHDEVEWLDELTAECAYCGSPVR
jgi:hypothetical protein